MYFAGQVAFADAFKGVKCCYEINLTYFLCVSVCVNSLQGRLQPVVDLLPQPAALPHGSDGRSHPRKRSQSEVNTYMYINIHVCATVYERDELFC